VLRNGAQIGSFDSGPRRGPGSNLKVGLVDGWKYFREKGEGGFMKSLWTLMMGLGKRPVGGGCREIGLRGLKGFEGV
jgi:hypothetical protein